MEFSRILILSLFISSSFVFASADEGLDGKQEVIRQLENLFSEEIKPQTNITEVQEDPYVKVVDGKDGLSTLVYRCRYSDCKEVSDGLEAAISRNGLIEESEEKNMVIVSDTTDRIEQIKEVIIAMDVPIPQILVEAKVIEVSVRDDYRQQLSFVYDEESKSLRPPGADPDTNYTQKPDMLDFSPYSVGVEGQINTFNYLANWLKKANNAEILSSPNVVVSLNKRGNIVTGEDLPIQSTSTTGSTVNTDIKYKRTGIRLEVTPTRINEKTVKLQVNPEVSTVTRYEEFNNTQTPVITIRNVETELTVQDGEIIMLGGLYSTEDLKQDSKVPFLGDLPLIGGLFRSKDDSKIIKQLIFVMKVKVVQNSVGTFVDIERQAEAIRKTGDQIRNSSALFPNRTNEEDNGEKK
ncbi:type II secretion system protein GspD [Sedimentisphaera salicampi]|uniref:General secretion pathway protein D n=1 Tax=Sedimentisphaera salicampi TaxID=1941349 RepID=A0A1W6LPI9_9BACT|nr:type II secretion system protein GspD [Sedimentisphaera salicampi]ARN57715.1 General secretion pathway protein D [Sedimentisphaera salicampi]